MNREHDVIAWLKVHLEPWSEDSEWRCVFADDYRAHKTENVFHLCWARRYVLVITLVSSSCGWPELQKVEIARCAVLPQPLKYSDDLKALKSFTKDQLLPNKVVEWVRFKALALLTVPRRSDCDDAGKYDAEVKIEEETKHMQDH